MVYLKILFLGTLLGVIAGCGASPTSRMMDLVGPGSFENQGSPSQNREWTRLSKIGLVVHSDDTGLNAAPPISANYLETLTRRTEEFLKQHCPFQAILTRPPSVHPVNFSREFESQRRDLPVSHHMLIVFSGTERTGPEKIGEATVMTQMSGTVVDHSALAEVGVLRSSDQKIVFSVSGRGTESLEQLDAPIGKNQPSPSEARDILRAQAGQQALDRALDQVGAACQSGNS